MATFANVDENNKVINIAVVDDSNCGNLEFPESEKTGQDFLLAIGAEGLWLQTFSKELSDDNQIPRKNAAMIGGTYDSVRDAFIPIKPSDDYELDEETCLWVKVSDD